MTLEQLATLTLKWRVLKRQYELAILVRSKVTRNEVKRKKEVDLACSKAWKELEKIEKEILKLR